MERCGGYGAEMSSKKRCFLWWTFPRPFPYLTGLLNRMVIKAIAVSPYIRDVNKNHGTWERHLSPLCN